MSQYFTHPREIEVKERKPALTCPVAMPAKPLQRWRSRLERLFITGLLLGVGAILALEIVISQSTLPQGLSDPPNPTPVLYDRHGKVITRLPGGPDRTRITGAIEDMGRWLPEVTVALEDHRFYDHGGIDLYGITAAAWADLKARRIHRGASTVSQQLIKQELGKRGRQWKRKVTEAILALKLERYWEKDAILEGYLNRLDYGNRRIGAESASLAYFGKRCAALTLGEAIYLAGLPQAPTRYNPWRNPDQAEKKFRRAIDRLQALGYLSPSQAETLRATPPRPINRPISNQAPMVVDAVQRLAPEALQGPRTTSIDLAIQQKADALLQERLSLLDRPDIRNAAMIVRDVATGGILALSSVHHADASDTAAINAALEPRHAGSTLKPFVYQQAVEERLHTLASVIPDTAEAVAAIYADYDPKNFNKRYYGPVRLREALGNSLNIPAIQVAHAISPRRAYSRLTTWGLTEHDSFEADGAGFVLGNRRVRLLDLTQAYATLARHGVRVHDRGFFPQGQPAKTRMADSASCRLIEDVLTDRRARRQAFGNLSTLNFPKHRRTAVKTGTSSNARDAWVVGYTRDHVVGVWVGNLDGRTMGRALSVETAAPVWRRMVDWLYHAHHSRPLSRLEPSPAIVTVDVDALTGCLPSGTTRQRIGEHFLKGTAPTESSAPWYHNGRLALPQAYRQWCASPHNTLGAILRSTSTESWSILTPRDGSVFILDDALPSAQQQLTLQTDHPHEATLEWHLNGQLLAPGNQPRWPLTPGKWTAKATDPTTGQTKTAHFRVDR